MLAASWEVGPQSPWLVHRQPISVCAPAPCGRVAVRRRDPALAADGGGFARVDGVCEGGQHVRTVQVPGPGGRGTGRGSQASGLPTRNRSPPHPRKSGRTAPPGAPRASAEVSGALASCPPAEAESCVWGWTAPRPRCWGETETAARADPAVPARPALSPLGP